MFPPDSPPVTPYTQRSLTRTLPCDPQRRAWLRPGLPCCKGPPLSSQPLSSSISLTTGSTRSESASPGPSSFWIFHSRLSFSFQPHLRGNPGPGFIPAEPGPEQQPQDAFALSLPDPWSQRTRTRSHSPALTNPTQMTFPTLTVVGLSFPFLFFLLRHLSQAAILLTSPAHRSGTPSACPTPGPLLSPLWSCVSLSSSIRSFFSSHPVAELSLRVWPSGWTVPGWLYQVLGYRAGPGFAPEGRQV